MAVRKTGVTMCFVWCIVLWACIMDAIVASSHTNSSGFASTDGTDGTSDETTMEKGMRPFFDMVKNFLVVVQPHKLSEQSWLNLSAIVSDDGKFQTDQFTDWQNWAKYLIGFCICAAIGVLFFIVMPITGLIFCCCRCAGKCGGAHKKHDPKRAGCKRKTYCTFLLLLNTVALAGVVCAFLSNELIYQKLKNDDNRGPVGKLTSALNHVETYVNQTVDNVGTTVLEQFDRNKARIISDINDTANNAVDDVLRILNATSLLDQTKALSREVNMTQQQLVIVSDTLAFLSEAGTNLSIALTDIASGVQNVCDDLKNKTNGSCNNKNPTADYEVNANFSKLESLSDEANKVAESLNMSQFIVQAEEKIGRVKADTTNSINETINGAASEVDTVRQQIQNGVDNVKTEVRSVTNTTHNIAADMQKSQEDISKYSKYWWYGGLGISCLLLLVVVLYYLGVLFGLCGERPGFGAQCCNTGTGANLLMAGVGFTFMFAWLIMLVCVVLFLVGGPVYTEVCRYFDNHEPQELQPFGTALLKAADFSKRLYNGKDVDLSIVEILNGCREDKGIYEVMKLDNMVNLTEFTDLGGLRVTLDRLKSSQNFSIPNVTIISKDLEESIEYYKNAGLDALNFSSYYAEVNKNLTMGNLNQMGDSLKTISRLETIKNDTAKKILSDYGDQLKKMETHIKHDMEMAVVRLNQSLNYLEKHKNGITEKADALIDGLQAAEARFNANKTDLVRAQLETVINNVLATAQDIINDILKMVREDVGKCRPVYDAFYSATDAGCVVLLDPVNGFWFSVGWCLFFFIPSLIFAVKLAGLYRREHDEKDFDDPNYYLYNGHHQDTIPLTSRERSAQHSPHYPGMANSAYSRDSYMGPGDKYAPPPYGASPHGMGSGEMTPPPYSRGRWDGPVEFHKPHNFPVHPGDGARPSRAY